MFFVLLSVKQYAQIEKGTYVPSVALSGLYSTSPRTDTVSSSKYNSWSLGSNLGFGRFIKDNLLLTGTLSYNHTNTKSDYVNTKFVNNNRGNSSFGNNESIGASLLRYTFITENFAVRYGAACSIGYGEAINRTYYYNGSGYNYATGTYATETLRQTSGYTNTISGQINLVAGIQYFVSKNLAITGNMGFFNISDSYSPYQHIKKIDTHTINVSLTPSFNAFSAGLTYYIRPKVAAAK